MNYTKAVKTGIEGSNGTCETTTKDNIDTGNDDNDSNSDNNKEECGMKSAHPLLSYVQCNYCLSRSAGVEPPQLA